MFDDMYSANHFSRPLHGLGMNKANLSPAVNCWAISGRPLRGLRSRSVSGNLSKAPELNIVSDARATRRVKHAQQSQLTRAGIFHAVYLAFGKVNAGPFTN